MAAVYIPGKVGSEEIKIAREDYGSYVKVVVDIKNNLLVIGGEWHADGEKVLLDHGGDKNSIWGGGMDLDTNNIDTIALINLRPALGNNSQEILDGGIRDKFIRLVKDRFGI